MSWFDLGTNGVDLPDSTIIYQIEVELLADSNCTEIVLRDEPVKTEVYRKVGSDEVEIEFFPRTGQICIGTGNPTVQTANISGQIITEDGLNISGVQISCTNADDLFNKVDGTYIFEELNTSNTYEVTPYKDVNVLNGVSTFDLVIIQNHILGNQPLNSPYKMIAADVNRTGAVTVSDIVELRKLILLETTSFSNNTSWVFVPQEYEFINPTNPLSEEYPTSTVIDLLETNLFADFIGIKIGDLNGTATPNELISSEARNISAETVIIQALDTYLQAGDCLLYTSPSPRDATLSRMPSSA